MEIQKEILRSEYDRWKAEGAVYDPGDICYNFMKRTKRINLTPAQIKQAVDYGKKEAHKYLQLDAMTVLRIDHLMKTNNAAGDTQAREVEMIAKHFSRCWAMQHYFKGLKNIDQLLKKITAQDFEQSKK
jgi:hypothetical protein